LCVKQFIGKCSLVEWTFQKFHEAFQVKFYIKSKLTKCKIIYLQCIFRKFIVVWLKVRIFQLYFVVLYKNMKKFKISCCHGNLSASLRSVSAISEYFMLIQCLENIGEGLLHACISSSRLTMQEMSTQSEGVFRVY
jgi:hypothetical protein